MKAIVLLVLGLVLLGGAGFGGWTLYQKYVVGTEAAAPPPPKEEPPPPTAFLRLPSIAVPSIGKTKVEQFVTVMVTVEVVADKQPWAQQNQPRLIDAFITTLYGAIDEKSVLHGALVDIPVVKEKLSVAANKVLGPGVVKDVLIQVVMQRSL